ncbi:hypothetical protein [Mucilaginibacter aquariorum]|uniref:Uncharacterized protein n=1 Tax=Mucilaginibacter aquariorum TaxID=2967225 RepID=A0ABT1SZM5_9SPHI|nr:hypothetical protein [Mucilaginibacter aquariorum]MCQ6957732.1 hypothetical protein [Mucilaginibacter aquariorum]
MNQEFNIQVDDFNKIKESYLLIANQLTGENQKLLEIENQLSSFQNSISKMMQQVDDIHRLLFTPTKKLKKEEIGLKIREELLTRKPRPTR